MKGFKVTSSDFGILLLDIQTEVSKTLFFMTLLGFFFYVALLTLAFFLPCVSKEPKM